MAVCPQLGSARPASLLASRGPGNPYAYTGTKGPLFLLPRCPGVIWTAKGRGRLAKVRVKEAREMVTMAGLVRRVTISQGC